MTTDILLSEARSYRTIEESIPRYRAVGGCVRRSYVNSIPIRLASTPDELEAIYQFRYRMCLEEMNWPRFHVDHTAGIIKDPLDHGAHNFGAFDGDEVVGVLRVNFPRTSSIAYYDRFLDMPSAGFFHPSATSICTRLLVAPRLRGTTVALRLAQASYEFGLCNQIRFNFLDCNDHLVRFFDRLGYTTHRRAEHPEYGMGNVMRLDLLDRARLAGTRSPFLAILDKSSADLPVGELDRVGIDMGEGRSSSPLRCPIDAAIVGYMGRRGRQISPGNAALV